MRRVFITGEPPADWVAAADAATDQLRGATDEAARKAIIKSKECLWRDPCIRDWLRAQFHDKCWFSEARESVSAVHVDHFRPKGRIKDTPGGDTSEGYWWLAFDWRNYRICGQLLNVKKGDLFPICEGERCKPDDPVSLRLEAPILIDPLTDQARLISFEADEDGCRAISAAGNDELDRIRAERTIEILGLNLRAQLNRARKDKWDQCRGHIQDYVSARETQGAQILKLVMQTAAVTELKALRSYAAEFSSVADACIEKHAPQALKGMLMDGIGV